MNAGGDAAEQIVRMSLEGAEVAARITGTGAKHLAVLIMAVLKEEQKTHGKARLSNMIRSGNELKVFTVQQKDLKTFAKEAKRYGVLYSILREKGNKDPGTAVDVIVRAADAPKITRIVERFRLNTVDKGAVVQLMEKEKQRNPIFAKTEKSPRFLRSSERGRDIPTGKAPRTSVREELLRCREEYEREKQAQVTEKDLPGRRKSSLESRNGRPESSKERPESTGERLKGMDGRGGLGSRGGRNGQGKAPRSGMGGRKPAGRNKGRER